MYWITVSNLSYCAVNRIQTEFGSFWRYLTVPNWLHTIFLIVDQGIAGMNDIHPFKLTLTIGNGEVPDQVAYSVHLGLIRWRIALQCAHAEFCQSGSLAFHEYDFQSAKKKISSKTWVSCKVLYQAFKIFHFPIIKANWNKSLTWLSIIAMQSWNATDAAHTCYICRMLEMWDKIWSSQSSTMAF